MKKLHVLSTLFALIASSSMVHAMEDGEGKGEARAGRSSAVARLRERFEKAPQESQDALKNRLDAYQREFKLALEARGQRTLKRLFRKQLEIQDVKEPGIWTSDFIGRTIFEIAGSPDGEQAMATFVAAARDNKEIVPYVLEYGEAGGTLLHAAVDGGSLPMVQLVVQLAQENLNAADFVDFMHADAGEGDTALAIALEKNLVKIISFLLSLPEIDLWKSWERSLNQELFDRCVRAANEIIKKRNEDKRAEVANAILATGKLPISSLEFLTSDYVVVDQPFIPVPEEKVAEHEDGKEPVVEEGKEPIETLADLEGDLEHTVATSEDFDTTTGRINDLLRTRPGTTEEVSRLNYLTNLVARVVPRYINSGYIDLVNHILNIYGTGFETPPLRTILDAVRKKQSSDPEKEWGTMVSRIDKLLSPTGFGSSGGGASSSGVSSLD